jgi:hypothetical protein
MLHIKQLFFPNIVTIYEYASETDNSSSASNNDPGEDDLEARFAALRK